jgi:simple sugar transport system ATP-binding protein
VTAAPAVELRGITKRYGRLVANDGIDFSLRRGEVHALLGENGAGKSTLVRVLYGLAVPDSGEILVDGRPTPIRSPRDAIAAGIGLVSQHFSLVAPLTVAENVVLGAGEGFRVDRDAARRRVAAVSERVGIRVDPAARVETLSVGQRQRVEILKALYRDCRVLLLDEPTAVLAPQETEALFATIARLRTAGLSVVFITHKLHEVSAITDRVTVLRRGVVVGTVATAATDHGRLARLMIGRPMAALVEPDAATPAGDGGPGGPAGGPAGAVVLRVERLHATGAHGRPAVRGVSLEVRGGELLAIAGVAGNGQTELADVLCGVRPPTSGSVRVDGVELAGAGPARIAAAGVGRIPEDRHAAVVGDLSVAHNLALERLRDYRRGLRLDQRRMTADAERLIARFAIKAGPGDPVRTLSGGNIQKVLLARVLARQPKLVVVSQPTRGLDVGATEYVRAQLLAQRDAGAAVLLLSEDLDEILALADRIAVLYEGALVGELPGRGADLDRLGLLLTGGRVGATRS